MNNWDALELERLLLPNGVRAPVLPMKKVGFGVHLGLLVYIGFRLLGGPMYCNHVRAIREQRR